jgi:hypothetical protein
LDPLIKSQLLYQLSYAPFRLGIAVPRDALDTKPGEESKGGIPRGSHPARTFLLESIGDGLASRKVPDR